MRLSQIAVGIMVGLFSTTLVVTQAQAECSSNLPYDKLVDCIVVEGSGARYSSKLQKEIEENVIIETVTNRNFNANTKPKTRTNDTAVAD